MVLPPIITFPVQVDKKTWEAFRARCEEAGYGSVKQAIYTLIEHIILHGFPVKPPQPPLSKKGNADA